MVITFENAVESEIDVYNYICHEATAVN